MRRKLLSDISASTLQVVINQLCGLVIFYVLSTRLTKLLFGELNWTLAVLLTVFSILSFGIDQVMVKKIAARENSAATLSAYIMHVLITGGLFYVFLIGGYFLLPGFFSTHNLLLVLGAGKLLLFFSSPYKQLANGSEQFRVLLYMSTVSNIVRSAALLFLLAAGQISLHNVLIVFVCGDVAEFIVCLLLTRYRLQMPLAGSWNRKVYVSLLKEALPQTGVVLFTTALSRFDWIYLGIFCSAITLANYSFAYKVFEVATVPLLVIAPLLIPRFTKLLQEPATVYAGKKNVLLALLRYEIIIACMVALVLNIAWVPLVDAVTGNKYGAVNRYTILLLSASMPFLYFNNFLWTVCFAKGDLKPVFKIFLLCFIINIAGVAGAVPFYDAEGAAAAYLFSIILQSFLFYRQHRVQYQFTYDITGYLVIIACTFAAGLLATALFDNTYIAIPAAVLLLFILLGAAGYISKKDIGLIHRLSEI